MIRIMFVDDDPQVLQGLQRLFHSMHREWEMHFFDSAEAGLELLSQLDFDVVVSDVMMPGMDGIEFLSEIKNRHPQTIRIALSGQCQRSEIIKSLGSTHRFLSKPCEPDTLRSVVSAACALRDVLASDHLRNMIAGMDVLPSPSKISRELNDALAEQDVSISKLGSIIEKDPAVAAKILQMANSAFFGVVHKISNIAQAVSILGIDSVKMLMSISEIFSSFKLDSSTQKEASHIYEHSLRVGGFVRELTKYEKLEAHAVEDAIVAGLLHDIGRLVLAWKSPYQYKKVTSLVGRGAASCQAEMDVFGATHAEVGAYLLGLWGLPETIVEVIAFHHTPYKSGATTFTSITATHVANAFDHASHGSKIEDFLDTDHMSAIGMEERVPCWKNACGLSDELRLSA